MAVIRGLLAAIYIGIQIESNWTKKWLYALYILLFSFSTTLPVIIIYGFLGGGFDKDIFRFAFVGSLFYFVFSSIFFNTSFTVIDDREHYRMLKYIIVSKTNYIIYALGRALGYVLLQISSSAIVLVLFIPIFKVSLSVNFLLLIFSVITGFVGSFGIALMFASYYLLSVREETSLMDILFGALFLISGAMFPPTILPKFGYIISLYFPLSSAIELGRYALFGKHLTAFFSGYSTSALVSFAFLVNILYFVLGLILLNFALKSAIKKGYIDITTAF
ncbi:ABC transporter permease [Caldisericum exile]|uniref:Transport permease protein n=1 Tax=Caldisericum exile (strain DSM 21853 / NBRC 104410 / AZM16c01) TaxID=511051 RepID=A0A7U6JED9_CALEA|nr:ABC transporter permease [Caldisericum exile]BAL80358.1 putative ABC transporter permease protein [Caldisericum exile AZM16c01]